MPRRHRHLNLVNGGRRTADSERGFSAPGCDGSFFIPVLSPSAVRCPPFTARASVASLSNLLLDFGNRQRGIEVLRAGLRAVHDRMTAIEPERVFECIEPLPRRLIAAVDDPPVGGKQRRRPKVSIAVPPIARARGRTARAQDAGSGPVDLLLIFFRL